MSEEEKPRMVFKTMNYLIVDHGLTAHLEITDYIDDDFESLTIYFNSSGMGFAFSFINDYKTGRYLEEIYAYMLNNSSRLVTLEEPNEIVSRLLDQIEIATIGADLVLGGEDEL